MRALQRPVVRATKRIYRRNETVNLFAALEIASGQVFARTTELKKRDDFRIFLDGVVTTLPEDDNIHAILDNYGTYERNEDLAGQYAGRVRFELTPGSDTCLNQIETWFEPLTRKALHSAHLRKYRPTPQYHYYFAELGTF